MNESAHFRIHLICRPQTIFGRALLCLKDGGMIHGDDDLVDLVLQLADEPYQVASTTSGAKT